MIHPVAGPPLLVILFGLAACANAACVAVFLAIPWGWRRVELAMRGVAAGGLMAAIVGLTWLLYLAIEQ